MQTLALQALVTLVSLFFGAAAIFTARQIKDHEPEWYYSWWLAGVAFLGINAIKLTQNIFGTAAFFAGEHSDLWDSYLRWAPSFNHSRTLGFACLFTGFLLLRAPRNTASARKRAGSAVALTATGVVGGALIGILEGSMIPALHYRSVAILDTVELLIVLSVLFVLLVSNSIDRLLWFALSIYAFRLALNAVWISALMPIGNPGMWSSSPAQMHMYRAVLASAMLVIAIRRLRYARNRVEVPGLLDSFRQKSPPVTL